MDNASVKLPVYLKISQIFMGIVIFFFILFMGFLYAHKKGALKWL